MNPPSLQGDRHVFHFRLRALMAGLGFLAGLLPGLAFGASSEPLDLDLTVINSTSVGASAAGLPLRVVLDSDENPRAAGAGQRLVTDANGRIQRELQVKADRRSVSIYNLFNVSFFGNRVETIKVGFELTGLGGQPVLYWLWFDYYTHSASKAQFAYAQDTHGNFVRELHFNWDAQMSSDYRHAPKDN